MAPNSPACPFIHASIAGSRWTAPLNRSKSVLIAAPPSAFEICGYVAPDVPTRKIPRLEQSFVSKGCRSRPTPQSFITRRQIVESPRGHPTLVGLFAPKRSHCDRILTAPNRKRGGYSAKVCH